MKRIKIVLVFIICLFIINVNADEIPTVISHQVMVTNKDGTICYKDGSKTDKVIPYKTMLTVSYDINGSYINVINDEYDCDVKYSDVSSNTQKFNIDTKGVEKINSVRAIVLPNTGLNMRIGPSVTYAKVITIPENTIVTLNYKAGTYWYYTEYNGKAGWITAMNRYLGFDSDKVLISYEKTKLYDKTGKTVLMNIPENTEITDYIKLEAIKDSDFKYYVVYNGTKGYIKNMLYKTNGNGKIKLTKDIDILDDSGNPTKRMSSGSELEYTMIDDNGRFYFPEKKALISLTSEEFEYIKEAKALVKEKGYIGEGLFGEEKKEREVIVQEEEPVENKEAKKEDKSDIKDIIIIGLLGGIFIALVAIVIIKLTAKKNKKAIVREENNYSVLDSDINERNNLDE